MQIIAQVRRDTAAMCLATRARVALAVGAGASQIAIILAAKEDVGAEIDVTATALEAF